MSHNLNNFENLRWISCYIWSYVVIVFTLHFVWQIACMKKSITTIFLLFSCDFNISTSLFHRSLQKFFLRFYLFMFRERGRKGEREGEKHWYVRGTSISCLSCLPHLGHQTRNPGVYPDQELNQHPFALWYDVQPTEPHQSGLQEFF